MEILRSRLALLVPALAMTVVSGVVIACSGDDDNTSPPASDAGPQDSSQPIDSALPDAGTDAAPQTDDADTTPDTGASDAGSDAALVPDGDGIFSPSFDGDSITLPHVLECAALAIQADKDAGQAYPNMRISWTGASSLTTFHCSGGAPNASVRFQYAFSDGGVTTYMADGTTGSCDVTFAVAGGTTGQRNAGTFSGTLTSPGLPDKALAGGTFGCTIP